MSKLTQIGFLIVLALATIFLLFNARLRQFWESARFPDTSPHDTPAVKEQAVELPKVIYSLAGTIQSLGEDYIVINATIFQLDEEGQVIQIQEERKTTITASTRFNELSFVAQEGTNRKTPQETPLQFRDFRRGDYIEVISNRDISRAKEFEATQVRMLPRGR